MERHRQQPRPITPEARPYRWLAFASLVLAALVTTAGLASAMEVQACSARIGATLTIDSDPAACLATDQVVAISASVSVLGDLGGNPGRQPLLVTKKVDQTSATLFLNALRGTILRNVLVVFFDGTAARRGNRVLTILLTNATIKRFSQEGQDQRSGAPVETVEFDYEKLHIRDDTSRLSGCWDFTSDTPC